MKYRLTPVDVLYSIPAPAPEANGRYYVQWRLTKTASSSAFWGGAVNISLWNSETDTVGNPNTTYADTNIAQIAVSRGTGSALQTVEAGKIESEVQGGVPRFFVYYTTNNYEEVEDPDWVGGYIPVVKGFKQTHPTIFPGTAFQAGQLSVLGGAQRIWFFEVSHSASGNAWWVYVNGEQVGFFPECHNANDAAPCSAQNPYLFSSTGMRPEANTVSYYGEVNDSWAPNATYTDMGSGKPASAGWTQAAYMRAMQVTPSGSLSNWQWLHQAPGALSTRVTDAGCYSMGGPFFNGGPGWQNWFYFGGMGALNLGFPLPTMNPNCPLN